MENQNVCSYCGVRLEKNAFFCIQCGAAVKKSESCTPADEIKKPTEAVEKERTCRLKTSVQEPDETPMEENAELQPEHSAGLRLDEEEGLGGMENPFLSPKGGGIRSILHPNVKPFERPSRHSVMFPKTVRDIENSGEVTEKPTAEEPEQITVEAPQLPEREERVDIPVINEKIPEETATEEPTAEEPERITVEAPQLPEREERVDIPVINEKIPEETATEEPTAEEPEQITVEAPQLPEREETVDIPVINEKIPEETATEEPEQITVEAPQLPEREETVDIPAETTVTIPEVEDVSKWMQPEPAAKTENETFGTSDASKKQLADHIRKQVESMYQEPTPMPEETRDDTIQPQLPHNRIITAPILGGIGGPTVKELSKSKPTRFGKANSDTKDVSRRK